MGTKELFILSAVTFSVCFTAFFCYVVDHLGDSITRLLKTLRLTPMTTRKAAIWGVLSIISGIWVISFF